MYQSGRFAAPKRRFRAKDENAGASAAGGEQQPLRSAGTASGEPTPQSQAGGRLEASRAGVQPAAATPGDETQVPTVDTERVAVSDADRIRSKPEAAKGSGVAAVVDADAPTRRAGAEREAPASRQREPEDGPPVRAATDAIEAPDVSARSDSGSDSSLCNESLVTLVREAGSATVGSGSTEPAAERATGRSERSSGAAWPRPSWHRPRRRHRQTAVPVRQASGGRDVDCRRDRFASPSACCVRAGRYRGGESGRGLYAVRLGVIERQQVEREHAAGSTGSDVGRRRCFG